jgi:aspartyl-tRNA(Asn)/glutamyl-tRNA(Gln) amidotransferase subunit A
MNYVTDWSTLSKQIGAQKGILQDFPIAIKDNICTLEGTTTCASRILQGYKSPFEAAVVRKLKKQGALMIGKTNMDEFGMGSFTVNTFNGPCINPKDSNIKRAAGGSSGGSAVAVAANFCFAAIGSDTGGSVRLPAAYCGVVGFKPSYGRISRYGLITYAHSLDTIGIFSQTVKDASLIYGR